MSRIMAIDYGTRRVGIAATDPLQIIASPVTTIKPENLMGFMREYFTNETVQEVIIGYPTKEDGSPTHLTEAVNLIFDQLQKSFPKVNFIKHDERYTSKLAAHSLVASGASKKKRQNKSNLDQISATLILQSFMNQRTTGQ